MYILAAISAFLIYRLLHALYNTTFHSLTPYPGPLLYSLSRLPWAHSIQTGHYHHTLHTLHQKYGAVVRIAPNELSYISSAAWDDIYGTHAGRPVFPRNAVWSKDKNLYSSVMAVDEGTHLRNRRALMGAFTEYAVAEHAGVMEGLVGAMAGKFDGLIDEEEERGAGTGARVNIVDWFNFLTFDVSGVLAFGRDFGSVENGKAHPWVEISCEFGKGVALMASINFFGPLDRVLKRAMPKRVMEKMNYHMGLTAEKVKQRLEMTEGGSEEDYVGSITRYYAEKGKTQTQTTDIEMADNMSVLVFAGSETTSTAMASVVSHLLRYPEAKRKLEEEIRGAFESEEHITVASTAKLEYLTAVIKEGIRLGPPASIGVPRVVPKGGAMVCGKWVPEGTLLAVNQYPAFRSATNFSNPDTFIPERFLEGLPGDNMSVFEPFLVGRHKCIGQKLAWAEMRLTLSRLLYSFDITASEEVKDFAEQKTFIFWEKEPLVVELRRRE